MVKVSVILPVYNVEKYLRQCLESITNQTLKDIEIICINDGSTDNSLNILNEYAEHDKRFVIISQENQGQGVARNKGIDIANGEYIQFVDPDDWIELDALETLYNFAKSKNSQVVKFDYKDYNDYSGKITPSNFVKNFEKIYEFDLKNNSFYSWYDLKNKNLSGLGFYSVTYLCSTDFIKSNNIKYGVGKLSEDHIFVISLVLLANKIDFLNKSFYLRRLRFGSSVFVKSDNNFCVLDNLELIKDFLIKHNFYYELENVFLDYAKDMVASHYPSIPKTSIKRYENLCLQYFHSIKELKKIVKKKINLKRSFLEQIFSIKGKYRNAIKYKCICIFGIEFLIKPKRKKKEEN